MDRRYYTHDQYLEYLGIKNKGQGQVIIYTRVSSYAQKPDLKNQVKALREYCYGHSIRVDEWVEEVGSALNYKRKKFNHIFEQIELGEVSCLIVAHKDRLVLFGFEWFENFCERHGTKLMIVNGDSLSPESEIVPDLIYCPSFMFFQHGYMGYVPIKNR